jgi:hypothetical protein
MGAAQTSPCGNNGCSYQAVNGFGVKNNTTALQSFAWGFYGECDFVAQDTAVTHGGCTAMELNEVMFVDANSADPWDPFGTTPPGGNTYQAACGGANSSPTTNNCNSAIL